MSIKIKLVKYPHPRKEGASLLKVQTVTGGVQSLSNIAEELSKRSALSEGDCLSTLTGLADIVADRLSQGLVADLGPLGRFRPSVRALAVERESDFTAAAESAEVRVVFVPAKELKDKLSSASIERIDTAGKLAARATASKKAPKAPEKRKPK